MVFRIIILVACITKKIAWETVKIIRAIIFVARIMQMVLRIIILAACVTKKIAWETLRITCAII
jgi:hypothetical protein